MGTYNRLDKELFLIAALLRSVQTQRGDVFNTRALAKTLDKIQARVRSEGLCFLTKTLPKLGKALDRALSEDKKLNSSELRFAAQPGSELPRFLGEFFNLVFDRDGTVLPNACTSSVRIIRQICYLFYKYEIPYTDELEDHVVQKFVKTESDLVNLESMFLSLTTTLADTQYEGRRRVLHQENVDVLNIVREARILLNQVFSGLDLTDIIPSHGPGVVATKQRNWEKYEWTNISSRIRQHFPADEFFYSSLSHVADVVSDLNKVDDKSLPARVLLVPKDSRGPRLISCEPVDNQWIQQGIMRKVVQHVESLDLTRYNIHFTDQNPNRLGALCGSQSGRYATLDLNEASDRVSTDLVRLLFPEHVFDVLECCRSLSTVLPNGQNITLRKFAPMGSALCFPVLALTIWAILTAAAPDTDTQSRILVYGDDVIVPTAYAANAMERLESFGLRINRDKSCIKGSFRESCGMDAFKGVDVTPVRIRTVWSSTPSPNVYTSYIAYANSLYRSGYFEAYDEIVGWLHAVYRCIPDESMCLTCPSLIEVPEFMRPKRKRINPNTQRVEYLVRTVKAPVISHSLNGWSMLLRYFTEGKRGLTHEQWQQAILDREEYSTPRIQQGSGIFNAISVIEPFSVRQYTQRGTSMLVHRWR